MPDKRLQAVLGTAVKWWKVWAGLLGLVAIVLWTGGACSERVSPGRLPAEIGFALPANAATLVVSSNRVAARVDVAGTVASVEKIHLSARIPAYVKQVFVSAGDAVTAGQTLIALDDREIREQLAVAEVQFQQAETEFSRAKRLLATKATTEQAFDAAESAYRAARSNVDRVKVMQTYTEIKTPIDGVITDRRIEVGDLANPGQVLLAVYDPAGMRLEASVPVRLVDRLARDQVVEVTLDRASSTVTGRVTEVVSEIDPMSRTQKVRILLDGIAGEVLPGTFGRAWVEAAEHSAVLVPAGAVYRVGQLEYVQKVRGDRVLRRLVKTGPRYGDDLEILSGVRPGDRLLVTPVLTEE